MQGRDSREKRTIRAMIRIYCRDTHGGKTLCAECTELLEYAFRRIDKCPYGLKKPACNDCTIHCYSPKMREEVKKVMRHAGPKMIFRHPVLAIAHLMR